MIQQRWPQVKALFQAAMDQPAELRGAFLATATPDAAVRREVESLLSSDTSDRSYLDRLTPGRERGPADPIVVALASTDDWLSHIELSSGHRIGPYKIVALLGAGAMGDVYRAHDTNLHRDVALKVLPRRFALDSDRLARFTREAHVLASFNHPNIAGIYGLEESTDADARIRALVLELVEGPTLADEIARGPLPLARALSIAKQIIEALGAAHEKGIIHRDLKPANIKIAGNGVVKVLDFGLAKVWDGTPQLDLSGSPKLTATDLGQFTIMGTPAYMSPEQARGASLDSRTDIWSFGCVLYEMLTGRPPFPGNTISDTIAAILEREPDWQALPTSTPSDVRRLLEHCLDRDVTRRLRDTRDAAVALAAALNAPRMPARHVNRAVALAVAAGLVLAAGGVVFYSAKPAPAVTSPSEYIPVTNFTDSAVAPALSPDGRMVTFIRGGEFFLNPGAQIYVKLLPNGESVKLTTDPGRKYGPVFTPDGSHITYTNVTTAGTSLMWETWTVPVLGGPATRLLPNASGLTWIGDRRILFSEIKSGLHMGIVTATDNRAESREIYFPAQELGMAHYSYASPDRQSVLIVEMDNLHAFHQPCRLVPFDGSSAGRQVGPQGTCTSAAWSPDGKWMYFSVSIAGSSHLWRQKFPDGAPEQITFGPTDEEGIALAPDGQSLLTSIGTRRSAIWIHDAAGERAISSEGYAAAPRFSRDGTRVFYLFVRDFMASGAGWVPASAELRSVDLGSGKTDSVLSGMSVTDYAISPDETEVAFTVSTHAESQIWLAPLDRRTPPLLVARAGDSVSFSGDAHLVFRSLDGKTNSLVRINKDGTGRERVTTAPILDKFGASPDGEWVIAYSPGYGEDGMTGTLAIPVGGGAPRIICARCAAEWSPDGAFLYVGSTAASAGQTLAIPVRAGTSLPDLPVSGIDPAAASPEVPGALVIKHGAVSPGLDPSTYVFTKTDLQRNLFRVPLH